MLETLAMHINNKDWSAVFGMHTSVSIQKSNNYVAIHFHNMELSEITADEVEECNLGIELRSANTYIDENIYCVMNGIINGVYVYLHFNGTKKELCQQCGGALYNNNCTPCNQRGI